MAKGFAVGMGLGGHVRGTGSLSGVARRAKTDPARVFGKEKRMSVHPDMAKMAMPRQRFGRTLPFVRCI
jgi:hypothetical protein